MSYKLKVELRDAVVVENVELLNRLIITNNLDLDSAIDLNGLSLLHYAVQLGKRRIVENLCAQMNDVNIKDGLGRTPLHYAAAKNDVQILCLLLFSGSNVNFQTIGGETPLMKAIIFGQINCIKLLLRYGADISIMNQAGLNSKQLACNSRNEAIINLVEIYEQTLIKLCLIICVFFKLKNDPNRQNSLHKLSRQMILNLTRYIIP